MKLWTPECDLHIHTSPHSRNSYTTQKAFLDLLIPELNSVVGFCNHADENSNWLPHYRSHFANDQWMNPEWLEYADRYPTVLLGLEVSFIKLDWLSRQNKNFFDYVIAADHNWQYASLIGDRTDNEIRSIIFNGYLDAIHHPMVNIIGHPFQNTDKSRFELDREAKQQLIMEAKKHNVAFEINNDAMSPSYWFVKQCMKHEVKLTFGSDAHTPDRVGRLNWCWNMMRNQIGDSEPSIVNHPSFRIDLPLRG